MRAKIFTIVICCFFGYISAQKESKFSIEIRSGLVSGIGNKFFADAFQPSLGFDFGIRFRAGENWGIKLNTGTTSLKTKNADVFGNFQKLNFSSSRIGGFYVFPLKDRINIDTKLFFGSFSIKGISPGFEKPYIHNGFIYGVGGDFLYDISEDKSLTLIGGLELSQIKSDINIKNTTYKSYYNNSTLISPNLGIRYNF